MNKISNLIRIENRKAFIPADYDNAVDPKVLYQNAKKHPHYITYHNYGVHLCAEGYQLKGIKNKIDFHIGCYYLLCSNRMKETYQNDMMLGYISFIKRKYEKALEYYKRARKMKYTPESGYNLACALYMNKKYHICNMLCKLTLEKCEKTHVNFQNIRSMDSTDILLMTLNLFSMLQQKTDVFAQYSVENIQNKCTIEAIFLLAYYLKRYDFAVLYIGKLLNGKYIVEFHRGELAIMVDAIIKEHNTEILNKFIKKFACDCKYISRLINDAEYRRQMISQYRWMPQIAEINYYIV